MFKIIFFVLIIKNYVSLELCHCCAGAANDRYINIIFNATDKMQGSIANENYILYESLC